MAQAIATRQTQVVTDLQARLGALPGGPWPDSPQVALCLPIAQAGQERPYGVLVGGVSPRRALDDDYRSFYDLVAGHVASAIADAQAYEAERKRAEALVELDRAKTTFFSDVSHKFRTPLTLLLGPIEEALADERQTPAQREWLQLLQRNALRLNKLVNTLLDFARIQAGRTEAVYEPTDLAAFTAEVASSFRSAMERAGMRLVVACSPLPQPVYIDREMWEKIVLNLLSNAFKFTFDGEIGVSLRWLGERVELVVHDTGVGIAAEELPHIFDRFYRVRGTRSRTHEGTGIGLALVQDLVHYHAGSVQVASVAGQGTTFTVSIPTGSAHLPAERIGASRTLASTALGVEAFVAEALRWLPAADGSAAEAAGPFVPVRPVGAEKARIVLADDNADMRDYLQRLLSQHWTVEAVGDGLAALEAVQMRRPDLLIADIMMPGLDGLGLLRALRADPAGQGIPIILLSARAGEEARIEGLQQGADEYLVKPFSARELMARVEASLRLARQREQTAERERANALHMQELAEEAQMAVRARDEVLAKVSHDLGNTLNAIMVFARLALADMTAEPAEPQEYVTAIVESVELSRKLISDLLDVAQIEAGALWLEMRPVSVQKLLQEADRVLRPLVEVQGVGFTMTMADDGLAVMADPDRIMQVLQNLVSNALKFTPKGEIIVAAQRENGRVRFQVADTGDGIAADMAPLIFDRFRQVSPLSHSGTGLGLTIVKGIVEGHGGRVWVESVEGVGSTFYFTLPVAGDVAK